MIDLFNIQSIYLPIVIRNEITTNENTVKNIFRFKHIYNFCDTPPDCLSEQIRGNVDKHFL